MAGESRDFPARFGKFELVRALPPIGGCIRFQGRVAGFDGPVDVRRMPPERRADPPWARRFVEEAKLATRLGHRCFVRPYELGVVEGEPSGSWSSTEPYVAVELVDGIDLVGALVAAERSGVRLPIWFGPHVAIEALSALSVIHMLVDELGRPLGLAHQRMSPARIWISRTGDVKLDDLGSLLGPELGEPGYRAPEQLDPRPRDARVDVFALGVILWECLAQRPLFAGLDPRLAPRDPPSRHNAEVPPELDACVLRALAGPPELRTASSLAFLNELSAILLRFRPPVAPFEMASLVRALAGEIDPRSIGLAVRGAPWALDPRSSLPPQALSPIPSAPPGKRASAPPGKHESAPPGKRASAPPGKRGSAPPAKRASVPTRPRVDDLDVPAAAASSSGWSAVLGEEAEAEDPHESPTVAIPIEMPRPTVPSVDDHDVESASDLFEAGSLEPLDAPISVELLETTEPTPDAPAPKLKLPVPDTEKAAPLTLPTPKAAPPTRPLAPAAPDALDFSHHEPRPGFRERASGSESEKKGLPIKLLVVGGTLAAAVAIVYSVPGKYDTPGKADAAIEEPAGMPVAALPDAGGEPMPDAEPELAKSSILSVMSKPSGAAVEINGDFVGSTPLVLKHEFQQGRVVHVVVQADGHQRWIKDVEVDDTGSINVFAELVVGSTRRVVTKPLEDPSE
ncbi:MAG: PEGA domain-containing protein [Deltaproteobacteria bacterium]|nr:PEGA domain-containing protein [Deltaproteobacteria bacterium]